MTRRRRCVAAVLAAGSASPNGHAWHRGGYYYSLSIVLMIEANASRLGTTAVDMELRFLGALTRRSVY